MGMTPDITDLRAIDEVLVAMMLSLKDDKGLQESGVTESNFVQHFGLTWTLGEAELRKDGQNIAETWAEKEEYADSDLQRKLEEGRQQIDAKRRGVTHSSRAALSMDTNGI